MLDRFIKFKKRITIQRKLIIINMVIAIIPVVIFAVLITRIYNETVDKSIRKSVRDSSAVIMDRISSKLKNAENCSNYLTININKLIEKPDTESEFSLAEQKAITNELYVSKIVFGEIDSIAFISTNNQVFVSDANLLTNKQMIFDSNQMEKLMNTSGKSIWFPCVARDFLVQDTTKPVLTLGKKVVKINTGETLGYILINIDLSVIENTLTNQLINFRLQDTDGEDIISSVSSKYLDENSMKELIGQSIENQLENYKGRKYFISAYTIPDYNWKLIGVTDLDVFNLEFTNIFYLVIVIALAVVFLEMVLSNYLSKIITAPLKKLKTGAEEIAGGNMKMRLNFKNEDEIGQLGKSFNYMTEQVQELIVKVDYEARKKQEYELYLLQEQVKPHFLYNCLDIIIKLSEMNRNREARRAARRLADYYRNSLSDSKKIINIGKEIKIVEDYLELQLIRYDNLFTYEVDVQEDIKQMLIPKLTLQPLVENAIYHGLKYKNSTGKLIITGERTEKGIILSVADNGIGMKKEEMDMLFTNDPEGHFGVYSVNHRIKLFFGEQYGIVINSEQGQGTRVDIILPPVADDY